MRGSKRSLAAILVLANYLLVLTVGPRYHQHSWHHDGQQAYRFDESEAPPLCACSKELTHRDGMHSEPVFCFTRDGVVEDSHQNDCQAGRCPVCQFLAQKPVPSRVVEQSGSGLLIETLAAVRPISAVAEIASTHCIRGPPRVS